ncbi:hypothetical protein CPB83DRAFT_770152 [Crepidotus variabilis]|uniref:Uncharacterized protein n=1 Tax=Crepidotus variabilis TaxID=179855 RepID=A0A9P6JNE7_9AGAR|nr:hypothetical protein CPB83DRAFT_770152 [Crepidotus variabilis]
MHVLQSARFRGIFLLNVLSCVFLHPFFVKAAPRGQQAFDYALTLDLGKPTNVLWDLSREPSVNSTGRWIFDTVNSFLKLWPNTRLRNGHSLVPGIVPVGTLLYHGATHNKIPTIPEWTSVDPEHSHLFCSIESGKIDKNATRECWHLTLVVTSPLKVLYFDGSGAAKMWGGPMDSQDLVAWGGVQPNRTFDEWVRIVDLCDWGKEFEIDAFVRMEMDFEFLVCDFTAKLDVASFLKLQSPELGISRNTSDSARVLEAGRWHAQYPSEQRIKLDYTRFISFYDTSLFPDLNLHRQGQERWDHRLKDISSDEMITLYRTWNDTFRGEWGVSKSGIDWPTLLMTIEQRYSERLTVLRYILLDLAAERKVADMLKQSHRHIRDMVLPYLLDSMYESRFTNRPDVSTTMLDLQWASPAFEECATNYIRHLEKPSVLSSLSHSEKLILGATRETLTEICRVLVGMWAEGTERGFSMSSSVPAFDEENSSDKTAALQLLAESWRSRTQGLMDWLDWSSWVICQPACSFEEMCYLPTWPWFKNLPRPTPNKDNTEHMPEPGPNDDWYHPVPRCIRRIEPFSNPRFDV